jgi:hypothetical protein
MSHPIRRLASALVCTVSLLVSLFAAAPALAASAAHFQHESSRELLAQLHHQEVIAVVLHPQGYKAHASLSDGRHFTATYTPAEVPQLTAAARAGGASFTIATSKPKSTAVHHKLRYIAGGVLIVVILVVLVVLLLGRRRALEEEGSPQGSEAAPTPPAP